MMRRIFVAIDISDEARNEAKIYLDKLRKEFQDLRVSWEKVEKLHITLKFLGDIDEKQLSKLKKTISKIADQVSKFKVKLNETGAFPKAKNARVLWIGLEDEKCNLLKVFELLESECEKIGFPKQDKKFHPHLTIARLKEPNKASKLAKKHLAEKFEPVEFAVSEIVIYESRLLPTGSEYSIISHHKLR